MRTVLVLALLGTLACRTDTKETVLDLDGDGSPASVDCDDDDPSVHPGALELCNGLDDDCDAEVDEDALDAIVWYRDSDSDGAGDPVSPVRSCTEPEGVSGAATDCDDADASVHPGADERCNDRDDDCDGTIDEDPVDGTPWYPDRDGDGHGDLIGVVMACEAPEGMVATSDDCLDNNSAVYPGAPEDDCTDPTDYNCDGSVAWDDADGDGSPACLDCDDTDPAVRPGQIEVCDGLDNDCDGTPDDDAIDGLPWYTDGDGDGWGDGAATIACSPPPDTVATDGDCDDGNTSVHPGAEEYCDGLDNDCDGHVDTGAVNPTPWYADLDGDGAAGDAVVQLACTAPDATWSDAATDCDDLDASVHPGAAEVCSGRDDDCDGDADTDATDAPTWYADTDDDGYGDPAAATTACEAPAGTVADATDCDDTDASVHPGADEDCDPVDRDCDGDPTASATDALTWYTDGDLDGHGDPASATVACEAPDAAWITAGGDCDDGDALTWPGAPEDCAPADRDCDGDPTAGATDPVPWYADLDGDGAAGDLMEQVACEAPDPTWLPAATDCDDARDTVHPGAAEVCNGLDDDCDGTADVGATDAATWYADADGDHFGDASAPAVTCSAPAGHVADGTNCADAHTAAHPGGTAVCDGLDDDCDGAVDAGAIDAPTWYADRDDDGFGGASAAVRACAAPADHVADGSDCDDSDGATHPGATEDCAAPDRDCDGSSDAGAADATTWWHDLDGDGDAGDLRSTLACEAPAGTAATPTDCDDVHASVHPGAAEVCNGLDDDCDGGVDVAATDAVSWYTDGDGDGYGTGTASTGCAAPPEAAGRAGDCDDADPSAHPGAVERCDGVDNDCDGDADGDAVDADTWWPDTDGDGYGAGTPVVSCTALPAHADNGDDCLDSDASTHPLADETCDSVDNDCDGHIDEGAIDPSVWYRDADGDGHGDLYLTRTGCSAPAGYVALPDDCDETEPLAWDGAAEVCDGVDNDCDGSVDNDELILGDHANCPALSCEDVLDTRTAAADGVYYIDPDGAGSFEVYCDMGTDLGGWTLVMKQASHSGYGSSLSVAVWPGWSTSGQTLAPTDTSLMDANMVNEAYSRLPAHELRMTASVTWTDTASGAWTRTVDSTPFTALSDATANVAGNLGGTETTPWSPASFTDSTWTQSTRGADLCWRAGPWFNQTSYEYTFGGVKWGWMFNNECHQATADTAEGLGCCGSSYWYRENPWTLYVWAR